MVCKSCLDLGGALVSSNEKKPSVVCQKKPRVQKSCESSNN